MKKGYPFKMVHQFHQKNYSSKMYILLLISVVLKLGVANELRGQEADGSSECDEVNTNAKFSCKTDVLPIVDARNRLQNNSKFEAENTNFTNLLETNGQNNADNVVVSSTLIEDEDCDLTDDDLKGNTIRNCNELIGNVSNSFVKTAFENELNEILVSVGLISVGSIVMVLNLIVIVVVYCTPKLRRNTYLNLVLSLSVADFLFGFTSLFNGIRKSMENTSSNGDFCFVSILITSSALVVSLYQTFLIGFHRFLVITGSEWGKIFFRNKRKYIWYIIGWSITIVPLSFFYNTLRIENDTVCSLDKEPAEIRNIIFCIIAIPEFVYMVLILVFYCLAMRSLKKRYLNSSTTKGYDNILNNKRQKYLKSMKSVSILLAVMFVFSGPLLVRNVVDLVQPLPKEALYITFSLANINSCLNPLIYFINIAEFKTALTRLCSTTQSFESSKGDTM